MEALHIAEITFTKWTVVISIFIIFGTIFYVTNGKNNNEKATVETADTTTFKTKLQPKINELTTNYNDIIEKIGCLLGKKLTRTEIQ